MGGWVSCDVELIGQSAGNSRHAQRRKEQEHASGGGGYVAVSLG